jgi:hypothetical protein
MEHTYDEDAIIPNQVNDDERCRGYDEFACADNAARSPDVGMVGQYLRRRHDQASAISKALR